MNQMLLKSVQGLMRYVTTVTFFVPSIIGNNSVCVNVVNNQFQGIGCFLRTVSQLALQ